MTGFQKIDRAYKTMPVLAELQNQYFKIRPLEVDGIKMRIGVCLHITKETAVLLKALENMGAEIYACGSNPLSTQDDIVEELNEG